MKQADRGCRRSRRSPTLPWPRNGMRFAAREIGAIGLSIARFAEKSVKTPLDAVFAKWIDSRA